MTCRIKWETLEDKEVRKQFASSISSEFKQLPDVSEDIEKDWLSFHQLHSPLLSFHQLLKVVGHNGIEWRAIVRKEHLGGIKRLKKLFEQRKMCSKPCHRIDRNLICNPGTLRRKNKSKEKSWEEFGRRLNSNYFSANKVFWQTICRLRGKRSSVTYSIKHFAGKILMDEKEILSRWRE